MYWLGLGTGCRDAVAAARLSTYAAVTTFPRGPGPGGASWFAGTTTRLTATAATAAAAPAATIVRTRRRCRRDAAAAGVPAALDASAPARRISLMRWRLSRSWCPRGG